MQKKSPDLFARYSATGMGATILANRLTYVLDLRGPSLVFDTTFSSSLFCLHGACTVLALRECDGAAAAKVNLIQELEHCREIAKAGVLPASSTCNAFDISAQDIRSVSLNLSLSRSLSHGFRSRAIGTLLGPVSIL